MTTQLRVLVVPALVVALAILGCVKPGGTEAEVPEAREVPPVPVQVAHLEATSFSDRITLYGRIEAEERVRISAELAGRVEGLPFSEGQAVGRGQTVARIGARTAKAQADQAEAQARLAAARLSRTEKLFEKNLTSAQELEVARAQAAQAEAALELARATLEKAVIRSPIEGLVTNVRVKVGELASPGVPLLEVVRLDRVKVLIDVPERDVAFLRVGTPVEVTVEAYPKRRFQGTVHQVGLVANAVTRSFPVEVLIDNAERELLPGMLARVTLLRQRLDGVVVVPRDAILEEVDGKSAYVVDGGVARRRRVEVGATQGRYAVVREGLTPGARLIVLGQRQVVDGQAVTVTKEASCCREALSPQAPATEKPALKASTNGTTPG